MEFAFMNRSLVSCGALMTAIFLAAVTHPVAGQIVVSDFELEITPPGDTPVTPGMFGLQSTSADSIVFAYEVSTGLVSLDSADVSIPLASVDADQIFSDRFEDRLASQDRSGLYNPLTCFDLNAPPAGSGLQIRAADVNGHTVIDDFYLYQGAPPEIAPDQIVYSFEGTQRSINVPAPPGSACFYRLMNDQTGVYGEYSFFGGSLSAATGLTVEYVGPTTVPLGDTLTYEWRITNSSGQSVGVHYQELFPANPDFFEGLSFASSEPQQRGQVTVAATGTEGIQPTSPRTLEAGAQVGDYLDLYFAAAGLDGTAVMAATGYQQISVVPARVPSQISKNDGDGQSATVGTAVAIPPSVIVRDENNEPVQGVDVTFEVTSGGGSIIVTAGGASVTQGTVKTDANGVAQVTNWTLGLSTDISNELTATSTDLTGSPLTFNATGEAGAAAQLVFTSSAADLPVGQSRNLTVEVQDVNGNLVSSAGLTVDFIATVSSVPRIDPFNSLSTTDARETVVGGLVELLVTGVSDGPVTVTVEDLAGSLNVGSTNFTVVP